MASIHSGLKTIPTYIMNFNELGLGEVGTHAFLVDTDSPQLFAEICTSSPNPSEKRMFNTHTNKARMNLPSCVHGSEDQGLRSGLALVDDLEGQIALRGRSLW